MQHTRLDEIEGNEQPASPRGPDSSREAAWTALLNAFLPYHATGLNVSVHLFTTPLGVYAVLALPSQLFWPTTVVLGVAYALALRRTLPRRPGRRSFWLVLALTAIAASQPIAPGWAAVLIAIAFFAQDAAHALTGESTFERSYRGEHDWLRRYVVHSFYLLPLVFSAVPHVRGSLLGWLAPRRQAVRAHLDDADEVADIAHVAAWTRPRTGDGRTTRHWWCDDLPQDVQAACARLADSERLRRAFVAHHGPGTAVECLPAMNEVYVTAPPGELSSDRVFYMPHVDGPWSVFPGASVYRCLLAVTSNRAVRTRFPLDESGGASAPVTLTTGDALAFDFNRTPHFIDRVTDADDRLADGARDRDEARVTLKLHYLVYPRPLRPWARLLGVLTSRYDRRARRLFVDTLTPDATFRRAQARLILFQTWLWERLARTIGFANAAWLAIAIGAAALVGQPALFVAAVSFVHYALYIATWDRLRDDPGSISFGAFVRGAVFWKTVSMVTLAGLYLAAGTFPPISIVGIGVGFGLAARAAWVLGRERTYFGAEFGLVEPEHVDRFPYGTIPHPMIVGSLVGLLGIHASPGLREAWPWLVPVHVALYLIHLGQELRGPRRARPAATLEPDPSV